MKLRLIATAADRALLDSAGETRTLRWIMAVMLFLTVLAAAFGLGALAAAETLDRQLAGKLTVQIVEADPAAREAHAAQALAAVRATAGVSAAAPVDRDALARMLRPWLGADGADSDLPIPAMIDVQLASPSPATLARVGSAIHRVAPTARIDRYEAWMSPVARFMRTMIALAGTLVLVMAAAAATVVVLAARAGLDAHRETIAMLHLLGTTDAQIARLFQRQIALETLYGGIAGSALALVLVALIGGEIAGLGAELVSGVRFALRDWLALLALPLLFALLATFAARFAVERVLGRAP